MPDYKFIFDLDSTITKEEILPKISIEVGKQEEMRALTEATMLGEIPFEESFTRRVKILSTLPISKVQEIVYNIKLNEELAEFIAQNKEKCYVVTGNLDCWICKLMEKLGLADHCYCSNASTDGDALLGINKIINKKETVESLGENIIVVGDGNNDAEMISVAKIGIGFGAVREIAPAVLRCCTHAIYDEHTLVDFLKKFI